MVINSYDDEMLISNIEIAKTQLLQQLEIDKLITPNDVKEYKEKFIFVLIPAKWYKFWKREKSETVTRLKLVRIRD